MQRMMSVIVMAALVLVASRATATSAFTVRDSIELTRFSEPSVRNPHPTMMYSPDGKSLAVVTTRGLVAENQVESTLWVFDLTQVDRYLKGGADSIAPSPKRIAELRGSLQAEQYDSYGALISSVRWSPDSKSLYYLGQNKAGLLQLFEVAAAEGSAFKALTPDDQDVATFGVSSDTVVYTASRRSKDVAPAIPGVPINDVAADVTGQWITSLLFPDEWGKERPRPTLWAIDKGKAVAVPDPATGRPLEASPEPPRLFNPVISADGRLAVVIVPVGEVPKRWGSYRADAAGLEFNSKSAPQSKKDVMWPIQYALLDLKKNEVTPLIDAPSGWTTGYYDAPLAAWTRDGTAALVTNSYRPIQGDAETQKPQGMLPCAVMVVRLPGRQSECVAVTKSSRAGARGNSRLLVFDAAFGETDDDVTIRLSWYNDTRVEQYRRQDDGEWKMVTSQSAGANAPALVSVSLRQDLNVPPALWARDEAGHEKKLWDPAPQLSTMGMGEASIVRWKDSTGYEGIGSLVKPPGYVAGQRYPLIVQTHGLHNAQEFITDGAYTTAFAAREFAGAGFVVLEVRDRHDHDSSPVEAANMVRGFESGIDRLDKAGLIDLRKVGIIGFSRTCYYSESALIHSPRLFAAASITDGTDESYEQAINFDVDTSLSIDGQKIYGAKPFGVGLKKWIAAAPGFHLDRVDTPLLITAITSGSILEEWEIYSSLRQQGKPVDLIDIPHGQHILQNPLERLASQQSNVDWFRFWLQGYEDPAPDKVEQYRRWEQLCDMQKSQNPDRPAFCIAAKH